MNSDVTAGHRRSEALSIMPGRPVERVARRPGHQHAVLIRTN
jgi:hypothetical protein